MFGVDFVQPFDRDIEVAHNTEMGVQPLQFVPYPISLCPGHHRREKGYDGPQPRQRNAHVMQGVGIAFACHQVMSGQVFQATVRDNPKRRVARHFGIKPRGRKAPLLSLGGRGGLGR
jgi:hypothetical protein